MTNELSINSNKLRTKDATLASKIDTIKQNSASVNTSKTHKNGVMKYVRTGGQIPATTHSILSFIVLLYEADTKISTIKTYVSAVKSQTVKLGFLNPITPEVTELLRDIEKQSEKKQKKGQALSADEVSMIAENLFKKEKPVDIRNHLIFLLMLWSACRTEELANFEKSDIREVDEFIEILIKKSKGDRLQKGEIVKIPIMSTENGFEHLCIGMALRRYLEITNDNAEALIRPANRSGLLMSKAVSKRSIGTIIKMMLIDLGIEPERTEAINGHSLRHTIAELAHQSNINDKVIRKMGRWKSEKSVEPYAGDHTSFAFQTVAKKLAKNG